MGYETIARHFEREVQSRNVTRFLPRDLGKDSLARVPHLIPSIVQWQYVAAAAAASAGQIDGETLCIIVSRLFRGDGDFTREPFIYYTTLLSNVLRSNLYICF